MKSKPFPVTTRRAAVARAGEDAAVAHLEATGRRVLARNVRFRHGELDVVALEGRVLIFVEVKTRASGRCGLPQEAVHARKQMKIRSLASAWMKARCASEVACRFDVIAVWVGADRRVTRVEHLEGVF